MKQILLQLSKSELDYTQFMEHYSPPESGPYYVNIRDTYQTLSQVRFRACLAFAEGSL